MLGITNTLCSLLAAAAANYLDASRLGSETARCGLVCVAAFGIAALVVVSAVYFAITMMPEFLATHVHWVCGTGAFYVVIISAILAVVVIMIVRTAGSKSEPMAILVPAQLNPLTTPDLDGLPINH